ncbi:MAG: YdeI/OmpD-associated family protein [Tepidiformaceae bacterium]
MEQGTKAAPAFFETQAEFRAWLSSNHSAETELWVGFHKVGTGRPSITWRESVGQALCFGWIDGVRQRIDGETYRIRFTPRKPRSIWSAVNIRRIEELVASGEMQPPGLAAFEARTAERSGVYSYENAPAKFGQEFEELFRANPSAWTFFLTQAPSYQRTSTSWVVGAKKEETRLSRLERLIERSAQAKRLG